MRKTIKLLLLLVMAIVSQGAWADDDYFIGHGENEPYEVGSVEDLIELSIRMKRHKNAYYVMCYVVLTNDIDMSAYPDWTPIGYDKDAANRIGFNGTFNGMGHSIYNLKSQSGNVGLFWKLWGADIRNVNFRNVDLKGTKGSVVCTETVAATIENVNVMSGSISITESASGICVNADMIKRCENHANVTSPNKAAGISVNAKNVVECINYGDVSAYTAAGISLSPNTTSEVQDCANYGTIDGTIAVGITLFSATGKLVNCLNSGRIKHTENPETPGSRDDECSLLAFSYLAMELLGNNMYVAPQDNGSDSFNPVNSRTSIVGEALEISNEEISNGFAAYYLQKYHQDNDEVPVWVWGQNLAKEGSHPILVKGNPNLDNPRVFGHVTMRCDKTVSGEFSNEVSFGDSFKQMVNHSPEFVEMDHDCEIGGTQEHWVCQVCHKIFKDEECTEETSLDELTIPAGHDFAGGVCIYCGYDISITEGDYTISVSATGKDFDYEKIECFDYIRCFVPSRDGSKLKGSLSGGENVEKAIEVFKKTEDGYKLIAGRIYLTSPSFESEELEKGVDYYIGIRAIDKNVAINDVSLSLKLSCIQHNIEYVADKEPTCTEHGHGEYWYCSVCDTYFASSTGGETDAKYFDWGLADHQLVDGVCQVCHYEVLTLELTKDTEGNYTYSDNVEFGKKGVYWGESRSMFRAFIPEHGKLNVKAYIDPDAVGYEPVRIMTAHELGYHDSYPSSGGVQSASQRRKAPEVYVPEQDTQVPGGGYVYVFVNNNEVVTSKLEMTLYSHKDYVEVDIEGKPATCLEDGMKTLYHCNHADCTFERGRYYTFTEDGIGYPNDKDLRIPALDHQDDGNGICSVCGQKTTLEDGTNSVKFLAGRERFMAFKYTATKTKTLTIAVETGANILEYRISKWSDLNPAGEENRPMSAPRRERGRGDEERPTTNTFIYTSDIVSGEEYAIIFITSADEIMDATITLSYGGSDGFPEVEGTLELASWNDENKVSENDIVAAGNRFFRDVFPHTMKFTALGGVTYMRNTTTSRWGTVILPYELKSNDEMTYYQLASTEGTNDEGNAIMTFSPVETVPANTPTVYRFNNEADEYQFDASTSEATKVELPEDLGPISCKTSVEDWEMYGFYVKESISQESYPSNYAEILSSIRYISKDKFMTATKSLTINPYRAVFVYTGSEPSSAKTFVIAIADGGSTSIQAVATANGVEEVISIYDINGRQLNTMQRGVNIIRTADGKTHKIINK